MSARHKDLIQKAKFDVEVKKINDNIASNSSEVLTYNNRLNQAKDRIDDLERFQTDGSNKIKIKLMNRNQKGLSNQYLNVVGTLGNVVLSLPIKPMHVIFKRKSTLVQNGNDIIAGGPIVNIYFVYKTSPKTINYNFIFRDCLFGAIKITNTTNSDTGKWQYSGYRVGFDSTGSFTHPDGGNGKNVIIFGADMSNSRHKTNDTQSVLVLVHGLMQKINDTTIYAEKMYSPNFTVDNKIFCLIFFYNFFYHCENLS